MRIRTTVFAALFAAAFLLWVLPVPLLAQDEDIWDEPQTEWRHQRPGLDPEMIAPIMDRLRKDEPQRAKELEKLQQEDPEAFMEQMRNIVRDQMRQRMQERREGPGPMTRAGEGAEGMGEGRRSRGPEGREGRAEYMRERFRQQQEEFMAWLEQNFPDEAQALQDAQQSSPEDYMRRMAIMMKKYRRAFEASKTNPELAEVLKQDITLKHRRYQLLRELRDTTDPAAREPLTTELSDVIAQRYDLIVRRKQIAYEELSKRLEELQKEIQKNEADLDRYKNPDFKAEHVKARVEELTSHTDRFNWEE